MDEYFTQESSRADGAFDRFFRRERVGYVCRLKPSGRVLDVGCGTGVFLSGMAERGFDVYGFEPSESAVKRLPAPLAGRVSYGTLLRPRHALACPGACARPAEDLGDALHLLKADGSLLVEAPNFGIAESRWLSPAGSPSRAAVPVALHLGNPRGDGAARRLRPPEVVASVWRMPSFVAGFLVSGAEGFADLLREKARLRSTGPLPLVAGLAACAAARLLPDSLPVLRLRARPQR